MKPYIGLVHQDPGSAYGITFPDAPGCFSAADRLDELFDEAQDALTLWLSMQVERGTDIAPTRELSEIKRDLAWTDAVVDAVMVIAVLSPLIGMQATA